MPESLTLEIPLIDELLEPHRAALGPHHAGYRSHAYRMYHFVRALTSPSPDREEKVAIMAALHDLPVLCDWNLVYVERAAALAAEHVRAVGRPDWASELGLMIENHHKLRPYRGPHRELVEATRRADWIDVSGTALTYGLPRAWVREVARTFPMDGLYPLPVWRRIAGYALRHPRRPMPMVRW